MTEVEARIEILEKRIQELEALAKQLAQAAKEAQHDLDTTEGLFATDGFDAYGDALREGCDNNGAWDIFVEQTFVLKFPSRQRLNEALAAYEKAQQGEKPSDE